MSVDVPASPATVTSNPYVGPESFRRGDRLYGRDRAAAELLDLLVAERIVLLHSPSGAGKTSLIQARMLSLLEEEDFAVLPVVRLNHELPPELADVAETDAAQRVARGSTVNRYVLSALMSLEENLPEKEQTPSATLAGLTLAEYVAGRSRPAGRPGSTVIVIDQFEEVITADPVDQAAKRTFFRQLGELLGDRTIWALLSMREDFLAELDPYARLVPTRFTNRYRLDLLTEAEALDAMILPARDAGVDFDAAAAGKLVDDLRTVRLQRGARMVEELGPYVEPVQLQVVCRGVWDRKDVGATRIGLTDVEAVGDVDEALAAYYAACMSSTAQATGVPERALREWCEEDLITPQGFRGQAMHGPEAAGASGEHVLELLTAAHLLRAESRRGAVWFELAHDRLIDPIKEDNEQWRRTNLSDVERRATLWDEQHRPDGLLLAGPELDDAEVWAAPRAAELTDVERDFLAGSRRVREQAEKEARANARIRRWLAVAVVGFILAVIASGFAVTSTIRAGEATLRASEAAALGQSLGNLPEDVQLSLRLAIKASALRDTESGALSDEAMVVLQQAVDASPVLKVLRGAQSPVQWASYSRDGTRIVSLHDDLVVRVWDATSGDLVWTQRGGDEFMAMAISPDGKRVALAATDGVRLWDVGSSQSRSLLPGVAADVLSFSPDGAWLVALDAPDEPLDEDAGVPDEGVEAPEARVLAVSTSTGASQVLRSGGGWDLRWSGQGAWAPKGAKLLSLGEQALKVWDSPAAEPRLVELPEGTMDLAVSQRGEVVAVQLEGQVAVYRGLGGRQVSTIKVDSIGLSLSADGRLLLLAGGDDEVALHDTSTGALLRIASQAGTPVGPVELNPARPDQALVVGGEGDLMLWDVLPGAGEQEAITGFDLARDVGMTMTDAGTVRLWSSEGRLTGTLDLRARLGLPVPRQVETAEGLVSEGGALFPHGALSPTGTFLAVTTDQAAGAYVVPLDPKKKPLRLQVADPSHSTMSLAVSPTGRYVVGGYTAYPPEETIPEPGEPAPGEPTSGESVPGEPAPTPTVGEPVMVDPDLPVEEEEFEGGIYVWDAATGREVHHWPLEQGEPFMLQVSPDERQVLGLVQAGAMSWDLATGRARLTLTPKVRTPSDGATGRGPVVPGIDGESEAPAFVAITWSPTGDLIATSQDDNLVLLWDARTGDEVGELKKHTGMVLDLAFDATGRRLVSVGDDELLVIWEAQTREVVRQVKHEPVQWAEFMQTERRLLVVDAGGRPSVVWLDGRELLDAATAKATRELSTAECTRYLGEEDVCSTD